MSRSAAVIGWGKSGQGAAGALLSRDWCVSAFAAGPAATLFFDEVADVCVHVEEDADALVRAVLEARPDLVVVSPGIPAHHPVFEACAQAGIDLWGEVELAWRLQEEGPHAGRPWLTVTGTNGKTTTVGMLGEILRASGVKAEEVGNIGTPITRAIDSDAEVFAVELSSFQLHWTYSMSPYASVVLNIAEDHVDWHGSFDGYKADKARVYEHTQVACIFNTDHVDTLRMVENADVIEGARAIGFSSTEMPAVSMLGLAEDILVDRAFLKNRYNEAYELAVLQDLAPAPGKMPAKHTVENALAAAALCRAADIDPKAVGAGLRSFKTGAHRNQLVGYANDIMWVNDSKATNPHAANASMSGYPSLVWIAGGLSKGVEYDELIAAHAQRLKAVLIIGTDTAALKSALANHAPQVPTYNMTAAVADSSDGVAVMNAAVAKAAELAHPGDTVLMAPASASMDQFKNYAVRGDAFANAVAAQLADS